MYIQTVVVKDEHYDNKYDNTKREILGSGAFGIVFKMNSIVDPSKK